jgi:hypothetical protein
MHFGDLIFFCLDFFHIAKEGHADADVPIGIDNICAGMAASTPSSTKP